MDWRPYLRNRLIADHPEGFAVITPDVMPKQIPLACPVCDMLLRTSDDESRFMQFECCDACANKWAYPNAVRWNNGWRPSREDIASAIKMRTIGAVKIVDD